MHHSTPLWAIMDHGGAGNFLDSETDKSYIRDDVGIPKI